MSVFFDWTFFSFRLEGRFFAMGVSLIRDVSPATITDAQCEQVFSRNAGSALRRIVAVRARCWASPGAPISLAFSAALARYPNTGSLWVALDVLDIYHPVAQWST